MLNQSTKSNRRTIFLIAVLAGLFIVTFLPVWKGLVLTWINSDEYSHGFFIIPITCYLIWQKKEALREGLLHASWKGLILVILSLLLYMFAYVAEIATLASLSLILFLGSIVLFFYRFSVLKELAFPLIFLMFMIPIPAQIYSQLTVPLQLFVTKVSVWFTAHFGIPIYREGNVIHLPGQTMEVARACSGLRSMISILPLGAILGYFTLRSNPLRYSLFLSGIPAAIVVNIVRVVLLVGAFYYFGFDLTTGIAHTISGIFIFLLAVGALFAIRGILSKWDLRCTEK
jgi:exosortase A